MATLLKYCLSVLLVSLAFFLGMQRSDACPFCNAAGRTLTMEVQEAPMVLYGELTNANQQKETTDVLIERIVKMPAGKVPGNGKKVTITGYHPPDPKGEY